MSKRSAVGGWIRCVDANKEGQHNTPLLTLATRIQSLSKSLSVLYFRDSITTEGLDFEVHLFPSVFVRISMF